MITEFTLPELGENIETGDVVGVLVSVGDTLNVDDPVLELETDKATVEVPSTVAGTVTAIHVSEGDTVKVGQLVLSADDAAAPKAKVETPPEEIESPAEAPAPPPEKTPAPQTNNAGTPVETEITLPDLGENVEAGAVVGVLVSVGDTVSREQGLLELETDKATLEVPSPAGGIVTTIHVQEGDTVQVGQLIFTFKTSTAAVAAPAKPARPPKPKPVAAPQPPPKPASQPEPTPPPKPLSPAIQAPPATALRKAGLPLRTDRTMIPAAPNVRRIARQLGVNIRNVSGTGPGGRINMNDVKQHANRILRAMQAGLPIGDGAGGRPAPPPLPDFAKWGQIDRRPMSSIRRATARQMETAWANVPHVTQFDKADITDVEQLRKRFGPKVADAGAKLTITAILLKVVAGALKTFPQFNASIDMAKEEIIHKNYYHIGVAVDTGRGLLVPVIRDVDRKNILELAVELGKVGEKARSKKLKLEEMQGATFTITNLGGIGGTNFTPIVNAPEVAILGVARGEMAPVFNKKAGQFEPRLMLPLSLSYDHRLIDGADGARFLRWIVEYLEQPFLTALQGW